MPKPAVFFTRKGAGITNLTQFKGKRLALGEPSATISLWAKVHLAHAGVVDTNLIWNHLDSKQAFLAKMQKQGLRKTMTQRSHSHAAAIEMVLAGEADIGVARRDYVQDFTHRRLEIVYGFESTPQLWVASGKVERPVVDAFRQAFIESGTIVLSGGPKREYISRMLPVEDSFFDPVRQVLTNEVLRFDGARHTEQLELGDDE
jgi:ABC-type phosphate/phosphonate transport system substrate-binding protein